MRRLANGVIWVAVILAVAIPIFAAAQSPLLQWRSAIYIAAGFAGVIAFALLLIQPLLILGVLPSVNGPRARRIHRWLGTALIASILVHVIALWITTPPDVVDALLLRSPTPFSVWGVIAMWAAFAAGALAIFRRSLRLHPRMWSRAHLALTLTMALCTIVHALLIDGTMELITKIGLSVLISLACLTLVARILGQMRI